MEPSTVRYVGSLTEFRDRIACAWPDEDSGRYTLRLWGDPAGLQPPQTLLDVRRQSIEPGSVSVWLDGPCLCRCGGDHDRSPSRASR